MKAVVTGLIVLIGSIAMNAQKIEPKFEVKGKLVKGTYYHDNGQIAQTGNFRNGKLVGKWTMYAENGKKIALGSYEDGKRTGEWFFWKANGEALREATYIEGRLVSVIEWSNSVPSI